MKVRTENPKSFRDFKLSSFDCFGTLIDWNEGVYKALEPIRSRLPESHPLYTDRRGFLSKFSSFEVPLVINNPRGIYSTLLSEAYMKLARNFGQTPTEEEGKAFGASVGDWPAFPDSVAALNSMKKHYKLVILSNVDRTSFAKVLAGPLAEVEFDAVYTAEDIGSYKPDINNFEYLLSHVEKDFGLKKDQILHTAQSLRADHAPAKLIGLDSAWIVRGDEGFAMGGEWADYDGKIEYTWKFETMEEISKAVEKDFRQQNTA
ncbi:hypothetical protein LTR84_003434 [Exophiala bonariae]|uniref:Haloacid dehalogenase, type II n=1 Tax=Exophiala bonariae TaxID=1690606 RepID=A0AAV9N7U2_9EURO|nr:hypothetical protein LTR84_003434 [Exophiala bonariae]